MKLLGASAACIFAFTIPFWYYMISVSEMRESLTIETTFLAKTIEKTIQIRPDMWEWEVIRMEEIASQPSLLAKRCEREIRTASGIIVAKTDLTVPRPVIKASATFFDSGRPVGSIQAILSIRTQIIFTALLGIFSSLLSYLTYFLFRTYPIRKLDSTLAELQHAEEEQRRSRKIAEQLAEETTVIAEIGKLIGSTLDIDEVYERVAAEARKLIPCDRIAINLNNFQENTSRVAYFSGLSIRDRGTGDSVPLAGTFSEELIRTQNKPALPTYEQ